MINLNHGYTMRNGPGGIRVCMRKNRPGEFVDINGGAISDSIAQLAGFDVPALKRERQKQAALAAAHERIEKEYATAEDDAVRVIEAAAAEQGVSIKHVGGGKYAIVDAEGTRLTTRPMSKDEAEDLLTQMAEAARDASEGPKAPTGQESNPEGGSGDDGNQNGGSNGAQA